MNTLEAIKARCSYRGRYTADPVPREHLTAIMQAGLDAPSGCNMQSVSLVCADDPVVVAKIREAVGKPVCDTAPAMICVITDMAESYHGNSYAVQDYSAAIENMLLAITELGYHSCWVEGYVTGREGVAESIAEILGVPEKYRVVCLLPVGKAAEPEKRVEKLPFDKRAWFNRFGC